MDNRTAGQFMEENIKEILEAYINKCAYAIEEGMEFEDLLSNTDKLAFCAYMKEHFNDLIFTIVVDNKKDMEEELDNND